MLSALGVQVLLAALMVLPLASTSLATPLSSCTGPTLATVIAEGPCTIGDKTFDFTENANGSLYDSTTGTSVAITPDQVSFVPISSSTSPGFTLGGLPAVVGTPGNYQAAYFFDYFSVVAPTGVLITSAPVQENGAVFTGGTSQNALSYGQACYFGFSGCSIQEFYNQYGTIGSATLNPTFDASSLSGSVNLYNESDYAGTSSFDSVTFTFNQSSTVPEPASLALMGGGLILLGTFVWRRVRTGCS